MRAISFSSFHIKKSSVGTNKNETELKTEVTYNISIRGLLQFNLDLNLKLIFYAHSIYRYLIVVYQLLALRSVAITIDYLLWNKYNQTKYMSEIIGFSTKYIQLDGL